MSEEQEHNMEDGWTDQDEEELREMFQTLDVDESGKLTCEEVRPALQYRGHNPTDEQVKMALKESDADGDGEYDYDEFKALVQAVERQMPDQATQGTQLQEALQIMMECLARDDDGTVTKEEFEEFLMGKGEEKLTQEEVDSFFDELDVDKTNTLTRDDLLIMLPPQKENAPEGE